MREDVERETARQHDGRRGSMISNIYREILGWFRRRIVTLAKAGISSGEGDADRTRPRLSLG